MEHFIFICLHVAAIFLLNGIPLFLTVPLHMIYSAIVAPKVIYHKGDTQDERRVPRTIKSRIATC